MSSGLSGFVVNRKECPLAFWLVICSVSNALSCRDTATVRIAFSVLGVPILPFGRRLSPLGSETLETVCQAPRENLHCVRLWNETRLIPIATRPSWIGYRILTFSLRSPNDLASFQERVRRKLREQNHDQEQMGKSERRRGPPPGGFFFLTRRKRGIYVYPSIQLE